MWPKKRTFEGIQYLPQLMGIHQSGVITPLLAQFFFFFFFHIVKFSVVLFVFFLISGEAHCGG